MFFFLYLLYPQKQALLICVSLLHPTWAPTHEVREVWG